MNTFSQVTIIGRPQPKTWADYRAGCLANYAGGHHGDGKLGAFQHGMETVFNLLEAEFPPAEQCKAAPELLEVCQKALAKLSAVGFDVGPDGKPTPLVAMLRNAIAKATGEPQ